MIQHNYSHFNRIGIFEILNSALKFILNMIPYRFSHLLETEMKNNLFDNQELLEGQSMCDYVISNPSKLKQMLESKNENPVSRLSVVQEFLEQVRGRSKYD